MNEINSIVSEFNIGSQFSIIDLGNAGGFSGSNIWKIESAIAGSFCLKRWPVLNDDSRIKWIHDILVFAKANGCPEIVRPCNTQDGRTFLKRNSFFWELCPWANGSTVTSPNERQLESAIETLARFHQATARYFFNFAQSNKTVEVRNQLLTLNEKVEKIDSRRHDSALLQTEDWLLYKTKAPTLAMDIARFLLPFSAQTFPVQPVIRDLRGEHLFFDEDKIVSIIDFGAMKIDSIACDLSRLLGSYFKDDPVSFGKAIDVYSNFREIYPFEREVILPLNHASVILGIANWLQWLTVENRQFDSMDHVTDRINNLFDRFHSY